MKAVVTGVTGKLGYDVVKELQKRGYSDIYGLSHSDLDITNRNEVIKLIESISPDVIFHNAAYTSVDKAEDNKEQCRLVNYIGTMNLVEAANLVDAKIIYISTDYVFEGNKQGVYEIYDKPNPINTYGLTKYEGEEEVKKYDKAFIVRISWVFGINGNNFVNTMLKLGQTKNEINVVCDQIGSPTYTADLAPLLVDMALSNKYGIYHATNTGYTNWASFAEKIFEINKINCKVNPITTEEYPTRALRPLNSKLSNESLIKAGFDVLPPWEDALDRYCLELKK